MRSKLFLFAFLLIMPAFFQVSAGEGKFFQEQPGIQEFSGRMLVRPLQADALKALGLEGLQIEIRREAAAARLDDLLIHYMPLVDIHVVSIPDGLDENSYAQRLMATGDYEYAVPDWICYPTKIPNDPLYNNQWHHPKMNCPLAWDLYTGNASQIASFVDTGIDKDHEDHVGHLLPGYNSADKLPEVNGGDVNDINGHGTWVAGCIGATGNNGKGVAGVNWSISLIPVRATNSSSGGANMADLLDGALWAAQNGAKTISVSYTGVETPSVGTTGTTLKNMDALLIWAADNYNQNHSGFDWLDVIVAGATDQNDNKASFSSYGLAVDVFAPGVDIWSTQNGGGYSDPSGTSFSAPLTNGVCALIWSYNPALTANEVEQILFDGCMDMGNPTLYGHGRVDAAASMALAIPILSIGFPSGLPSGVFPPGPETVMTLQIKNGIENYVPGSGTLHYRFDPADPYGTVTVTPLGGDLYEAVLPNTKPGDEPEFYFSAKGDGGTTIYSPANAPASVYAFDVYFVEEIFNDDFEQDQGWTVVSDPSLATGEWERGDPVGTSTQPEDDHTPNGTKCFVTGRLGGSSGDNDVDGGPTDLFSPVFDLSSGDAFINFYAWFYHSTNGTQQPLGIHISNNGGSTWTLVENMTTSPSWNYRSFKVSDFVTPTAAIQLRFRANDNPNDSIVEALLDDFTIERQNHTPSLWADAYSVSVAQQSLVGFTMDAGAAFAGRSYLVLGSFTGTEPGFPLPGGQHVPLNWDVFTGFILANLGSPVFQNFQGVLDGQGGATATFDTIGPIDPGLIGAVAHFAFVLGPPPAWDFSSNPIAVTFDP